MTKVSAIQMTATASIVENLLSVESLIKIAVKQESNLVVLPEMFPMMSAVKSDMVKISEFYGHGPIQDFLSKQAKKNKLWIVGGTIPLKSDNPLKARASCLVFNDQGIIVGRYDKIHLFDVAISESEKYQESATTEAGTSISVIATPFGKLGLSVCYDIRFPELFRQMFNAGAEIITIPAAFTVKTGQAHWEVLTRSRAIENFCYAIGACQVGTHYNARKTYGHSLIINPWGEIMSSLTDGIGVITSEIDLDTLKQIRKDIPIAEHQKIFSLR